MRRTARFIKQARRYLAVLAVGAVLMSGSDGRSVSYAGYSLGAGQDLTVLELDRDGADIVPPILARPAGSRADVTTLYLDRYGADIPEGNWWGASGDASSAVVAAVDGHRGPDITGLNLDRDGADFLAD